MYQYKRIWQPIVSVEVEKRHTRGATNVIQLACGHIVRRRAFTPLATGPKGMQCRECEKCKKEEPKKERKFLFHRWLPEGLPQ